ncbi:hypothetical protein ACIRL2_46765 [Embleya sp. NPDC127516]|uniref:hypothetical protein n=1 Tax=Embleya sp. NPDC127516 TaxID=3363990 RepID=UPI0038085553
MWTDATLRPEAAPPRPPGSTPTTGGTSRGSSNPHGVILIATSVIDGTVAFDVDTVISDLAPMDVLLQRAGRVRRKVASAACTADDERPAHRGSQ